MTMQMPIPPVTPPVGNNKAIAAVVAGAITTIAAYALSLDHIMPPIEVVGAFQTLVTVAAVYLVPHGG